MRAWEEENEQKKTVSVRVTRESAETGVTLFNLRTGEWTDVRPRPSGPPRTGPSASVDGPAGRKERSLGWFVEEFGASLTRAILDTCPPVYSPALYREYRPLVKRLARQPLGRQADALAGAALALERGHRCTILSCEMGTGKCLAPWSVVDVNGIPMAIEQIWDRFAVDPVWNGDGEVAQTAQRISVPSYDEHTGQMVRKPVTGLWRQPVREALRRVRLAGGETITVTRAHRFLTPTGWSSDIAPGSYVAIPRRLPFADGATPSPVDARFLAWLIAEGWEEQAFRWRRTGSVVAKITQKDRSVLESLVEPARALGMTAVRIIAPWGERTAHELYANATVAAERLAALGYVWGQKAARKRIPPFIMRGDAATVRAFLRAYVDAEGSVSGQVSRSMIEVMTASAGMANDVRTLLRRCGIYARVAPKMAHATNGSGIRRTYYRVSMSGSAARRFAAEIGCDVAEKSRRLAALDGVVGNDNITGIYVADVVARAKEATGLGRMASGNLFASVYTSGKQPTMNRATAERLLALLEGQATTKPEVGDLASTVCRRLDADIAFVRVEAIDDVDYAGYVYDLCVAETHNFVADHIVIHNTYMALGALYAAWRRGRDRDPQARMHAVVICPTHVCRVGAN